MLNVGIILWIFSTSMYCSHSHTYSNVFHLCWMLGYVQKKTFKIWHISHIVWMFYQHVAGSLTWITTAVWTAPSPSLCFCSSKCQFCFLSHLTFHVLARWKHVVSIFVLFEKMQSKMTVFQIRPRCFKAFWLKKWQTSLETVRWAVLCSGSNNIVVSMFPSLIAIVLSQTNKSKYFVFFPLLCLWCLQCSDFPQNMKIWDINT